MNGCVTVDFDMSGTERYAYTNAGAHAIAHADAHDTAYNSTHAGSYDIAHAGAHAGALGTVPDYNLAHARGCALRAVKCR
jgi:hypothetical protein